MFFCCEDTTVPERILEATYYEFSHTDPQTKRKVKQLAPYDPRLPYSEYQGWQRMKLKLRNFEGIIANMRERRLSNFYDEEFPHQVSSIGKNLEGQVAWLRVGELVKDPIYISTQTLEEWKKFRCSNKSLQSALYLLRKHDPELFRELLTKTLTLEGAYEFRMMVRGVLTNVIIDDYLPASDNMPINAKPYRTREVFPMLIEKALAKAFGSYAKIPQNPLPIVEALACTPTLVWHLSSKVSVSELIALKSRIDVSSASNCFVPRKGLEKIEHGLLEDEPYMIMAVHEALYNSKPIVLYEVINLENKGDWNGPFSSFDQNWNQVQPSQASTLKSRMDANGSMMIEETDVLKYFGLMCSIQKTEGCSQDWTVLDLSKHHAAYLTLNVTVPNEKFYIKTWASQPSRQVIILARVLTNNGLEFCAGNMIEANEQNFTRASVPVGVYVVFLKVQPKTREASTVNVSILSRTPMRFTETSKAQYPDFQQRLFNNMVTSLQLKPQVDNPHYSVYILYRKTGYAFLLFKLNRSLQTYIIDQKLLLASGYKLRKPHQGKGSIQLSGGQSNMLTFKMLNSSTLGQNLVFPEGSIRPAT